MHWSRHSQRHHCVNAEGSNEQSLYGVDEQDEYGGLVTVHPEEHQHRLHGVGTITAKEPTTNATMATLSGSPSVAAKQKNVR